MKSYTLKNAKRLGNIFTIDQMCDLLDLEPYDTGSYEYNWEYIGERAEYSFAYNQGWEWTERGIYKTCEECDSGEVWDETLEDYYECLACGGDGRIEIEYEDIHQMEEYEKVYDEVASEHYNGWKRAMEEVFDKIFEPLGLEVIEVKINDKEEGIWDAYKLEPAEGETWWTVTAELVEVINGVGYWWFDNVRALMDTIPVTTPRKAFFDHIHWAKDRPRVYGSGTVARMYDDALDHYLRNW